MFRLFVALVLSIQLFISHAFACTAFHLPLSGVVAKSFDWSRGTGHVIVNARGLQKKALAFGNETPATWSSKYSSVTFNHVAKEFPLSGINETGLVAEILWLDETEYQRPSSTPAIFELQWIQWALDQYSSIDEVIANLSKVRVQPTVAAVHFFMCDASRRCATVEWLKGQTVIHAQGISNIPDLKYPLLTNDTVDKSVSYLQQFSGFGGTKSLPESTSMTSLDRYVRTVSNNSREPIMSMPAYSFALINLQKVWNVETRWNLIYDFPHGTVHYRSDKQRITKSFDLPSLWRDCSQPTLYADIYAEDRSSYPDFKPFDPAENLKITQLSLEDFAEQLPPHAAETIANHSNLSYCMPSPQ